MKKILVLALVCFNCTTNYAQDINDALRYAQDNLSGTARFRAMGGAFGALGGDLSAISLNPAGSAIFSNNAAGVTLSDYIIKNNSNYFGSETSSNNNSFDINQGGVVYVFENQNTATGWKKFSLAANYENNKNFNNSLYSSGTNPTNSVANYFLSYANGIPLSVASGNDYNFEELFYGEQQAYFGYQGFIINPVANNDSNTQYISNVAPGGNYLQNNSTETSGYNGKVSFNAAAQYGEKLYVGINLNSHFTDFRKSSSFFESNSNTTATENINRLRFNNDLYTYGTGFSFQLGTIYKVSKEVRFGVTFDSPTWYRLNDQVSQSLASVKSSTSGEQPTAVVNPQSTFVFKPYTLQTPLKLSGSFAYVFGKKGLISLDYSIKDYSATKFTPKNEFLASNATISNLLNTSSEIRVGTEYKIKQLSLRAGYRWEESPYKDKKTIGDLTGYSGGIGYNFGNTKLDLAYAISKRNYNSTFFSQGLVDYATIKSMNNTISVSILFEL